MYDAYHNRLDVFNHFSLVSGQRVLLRVDLNVPIDEAGVVCDHKIKTILPTLRALMAQADQLIVMSHLGRPKSTAYDPALSLKKVLPAINQLLDEPLVWAPDWPEKLPKKGRFFLAENVRFLPGETTGSIDLAKKMALTSDVFVMDAFASAHREHASTYGLIKEIPNHFLGPLFVLEWAQLAKAIDHAKPPVVSIVGGSKVSSKMGLLHAILARSNTLILGGGIANTFLAAKGHKVGHSLYEPDWTTQAASLMAQAKRDGKSILLPSDVWVENTAGQIRLCMLDQVQENDAILDIGTLTQQQIHNTLIQAKTIYWNGPLGCFEREAFAQGTMALAHSVAESTAYSLAGGGDTVSAIDNAGVFDQISFVSTGGGAFLTFLESGSLPVIDYMTQQSKGTT
jgi:phosphoglycerate kinase